MPFERYEATTRQQATTPQVTVYRGTVARVNAAGCRRWGDVKRMRRVILFYCEDSQEIGFMPSENGDGLLVSDSCQFSIAGLLKEYGVTAPAHRTTTELRRNGDGMLVFSVAREGDDDAVSGRDEEAAGSPVHIPDGR